MACAGQERFEPSLQIVKKDRVIARLYSGETVCVTDSFDKSYCGVMVIVNDRALAVDFDIISLSSIKAIRIVPEKIRGGAAENILKTSFGVLLSALTLKLNGEKNFSSAVMTSAMFGYGSMLFNLFSPGAFKKKRFATNKFQFQNSIPSY